ncbi:FG-GAP repeat protein [Chondromyces crocatus]|uniref:Integrin n=1 Tax=Chondromyces crocatus TaxID=52 RepID=A0A0K1EBC0_CHOCO|nr:FG-GAP repeat protein [Chondromyces crocatus]AKT38155.1 uncharacterized protein CMC5_022980 [Chondromyces crocatus]
MFSNIFALHPQYREEFGAFGSSVSLSGNRLVVGARKAANRKGAAHAFLRTDTGWLEEAELLAVDGHAGDDFGFSIALSGNTTLVGAPLTNDGLRFPGAAHVFTHRDGGWIHEAKLVGRDGMSLDLFGYSVAIDGDTAVVGAFQARHEGNETGAVYVFGRTGNSWQEQARLVPADARHHDRVGISVAISGRTILIGADGSDDQGDSSGAAYVFTKHEDGWHQETKLTAGDGAESTFFGHPVALEGDTAFVGTYLADGKTPGSGAVYVYARDERGWTEQSKLVAGDGVTGDAFGASLAVSGDKLVVGAPQADDRGTWSGAGYVFVREDATWTEFGKFVADDGAPRDETGAAVGISGNTIVASAPKRDGAGHDMGSAYVFEMGHALTDGASCRNDSECISNACAEGICQSTGEAECGSMGTSGPSSQNHGEMGFEEGSTVRSPCTQADVTFVETSVDHVSGGCALGRVTGNDAGFAGLGLLLMAVTLRARAGHYSAKSPRH